MRGGRLSGYGIACALKQASKQASRRQASDSPAQASSLRPACLQHQARQRGRQLRPQRHAPPALVLEIVQLRGQRGGQADW